MYSFGCCRVAALVDCVGWGVCLGGGRKEKMTNPGRFLEIILFVMVGFSCLLILNSVYARDVLVRLGIFVFFVVVGYMCAYIGWMIGGSKK